MTIGGGDGGGQPRGGHSTYSPGSFVEDIDLIGAAGYMDCSPLGYSPLSSPLNVGMRSKGRVQDMWGAQL